MQQCLIWDPLPGLDFPCADMSFAYNPPYRVIARMRFSNIVNGPSSDLQLSFSGAIALRWESESFGLIPLPKPLPKCRSESWSRYTFPLLRVEHSSWLAEHEAYYLLAAEGRAHFALVSLNDLLHILALPDVDTQWIEPEN